MHCTHVAKNRAAKQAHPQESFGHEASTGNAMNVGGNPRIPEDHYAARFNEDSCLFQRFFLYTLPGCEVTILLLKPILPYSL